VRRLLTPKWWLLHVAVLLAVLGMLRLGLWQWHRANSGSGGIQNYAYAFQWPLFAAFAIFLWLRTMHEELHRPGVTRGLSRSDPRLPAQPVSRSDGVVVGISSPPPEAADEDPELAAWNARLAALNAASDAVEGRRH
jgi:DNA-binding transcriptional regulator of glucitol operon